MKKIILLSIVLNSIFSTSHAQNFKVDTLQYNGDISKFINIVILGDGYTAKQLDTFILDAKKLSNYLFSQSPWSNYNNYFNVFAIEVISQESGTKHPNTAPDCGNSVPITNPNTYFGCTFDANSIHRLVVPTNYTNIAMTLAKNFPNYDQVCILANTPYYGGSGGSYATTTLNTASNEIYAHEIGHSFAALSDEYYAGDGYAGERVNMTKETNPLLVKWKNWMNINGIGIYQHCCGGNSAQWYKPSTNCKMQSLGYSYCSVCKEALIERIHALVNPIVSYTPENLTINSSDSILHFELVKLMKPNTNTLKLDWKLDGAPLQSNVESIQIKQKNLTPGLHSLSVVCEDTTNFLNIDKHATKHFSTVTWSIQKTISDIKLTSSEHKISFSLFPNPTNDILHIQIELDKKSEVSLQLVSLEGKVLRNILKESKMDETISNSIDIKNLPNGTYLIQAQINDIVHTQSFIKQ